MNNHPDHLELSDAQRLLNVSFETFLDDNIRVVFERYTAEYETNKLIDKGTYGYVAEGQRLPLNLTPQARDDPNATQQVAIKKIGHFSEGIFATTHLIRCALRELDVMLTLDHPCVCRALDVYVPVYPMPADPRIGTEAHTPHSILRSYEQFKHPYLVMKYMEYTLMDIMSGSETNEGDGDAEDEPKQPLNVALRRHFMIQLLCGIAYMHERNVLHRDLKPANILTDDEYNLSICDFGQTKYIAQHTAGHGTIAETCTYAYAPPEALIIDSKDIMHVIDAQSGSAIDMWSAGCIAAEMLTHDTLFRANGHGPMDALVGIAEVMGTDGMRERQAERVRRDMKKRAGTSTAAPVAAPDLALVLYSRPGLYSLEKDFEECELQDGVTPEQARAAEIELITNMIQLDPGKRIRAADALRDKFFTMTGGSPLEEFPHLVPTTVLDPTASVNRYVPSVQALRNPSDGGIDFGHESFPEDIGRQCVWELHMKANPTRAEAIRQVLIQEETELPPKARAMVETIQCRHLSV